MQVSKCKYTSACKCIASASASIQVQVQVKLAKCKYTSVSASQVSKVQLYKCNVLYRVETIFRKNPSRCFRENTFHKDLLTVDVVHLHTSLPPFWPCNYQSSCWVLRPSACSPSPQQVSPLRSGISAGVSPTQPPSADAASGGCAAGCNQGSTSGTEWCVEHWKGQMSRNGGHACSWCSAADCVYKSIEE